MPDIGVFLQQTFNGAVITAVYALVALGLTLGFGLTGIPNFAHGQFIILGGFLAFGLIVEESVPSSLGVPAAIVGVALVGLALERGIFSFTLKTPTAGFVASLGLAIAIESLMVRIWGPDNVRLDPWLRGVWNLGGVHVAQQRAIVLGVAGGAILGFFLLLRYSPLGRAMRACAEDPETARLMGIGVTRTISLTFILGSALAAVAGVLLLTLFPLNPFSGTSFVLKGFAIALIGGLGSPAGALVGAAVLGYTETYGAAYWEPAYRDMFAFAVMIIVIALRPSGILGGIQRAAR